MNYGKKGVRAKQKALNSKSVKWSRKIVLTCLKLVLAAAIGLAICGVSAGIGAFKGIIASTPTNDLSDIAANGQATIVYDNKGNVLDQYVSTNSNRIEVSMDEIPEYMGLAFVAIEDERFFQHNGIDVKGIIRAGFTFLQTKGESAQGASTITQQLLKNVVFTDWTSEGHNVIKKVKRKIMEQYLALEVTKKYSKEDILLRYMNVINLGQNTLGVESASQRYFGKSCSELTLSECAVIASITQSPTKLNPILHPENNAKRREKCLNNMLKLEFITKAEYDEAMADTEAVYDRIGLFDTDYRESASASGSYFSDAVYEQVKEDLINIAGKSESSAEHLLVAGGLRIESTLDPDIQAIMDEEFANEENYPSNVKWYLNYALTVHNGSENKNYSKENMMSWFKANKDKNFNLIFSSQDAAMEAVELYRAAMMEELGVENVEDNYEENISMTPQPQVAMVVEDQSTGYVVALVGGRGTKEGRRTLNRATAAKRSPGSTFKVLASFAPALDSAGKTLATTYVDGPFVCDDGHPIKNWYPGYEKYGVNCSIRTAIAQSLNIIAVKNQTVITPQLGFDYLTNFGFSTLVQRMEVNGKVYSDINQTIALGGLTVGVTPYELNAGYATIANSGVYATPKLYTKVTDADGNIILDNTTPTTRQVIKETTAYLLTDAMVDVVTYGTGGRARFDGMAIAGKTGTSTDTKDVWFAGFTPYYTGTVWTGYDNNIAMKDSAESNLSKTLWRAVMKRIHEDLPSQNFTMPSGIVSVAVCSESGKLPIPGLCDAHVHTELFEDGTQPTESCDVHFEGDICQYEGLPASPECPFKVHGVVSLPLVEDPVLLGGTSTVVQNEDGTTDVNVPATTHTCQHNAEFFANPDYESILYSQMAEIEARAAAQQAAQEGNE